MILLDTDILIDVALDRRPHSEPSCQLLERIERSIETASIAWHTISNLYYIVRPAHGDIMTREFIHDLTEFVQVVATDTESIRYAIQLPMTDFEDAMQVAAARACNARYIVTRNIKDYERSPVTAVTPHESLQRLT